MKQEKKVIGKLALNSTSRYIDGELMHCIKNDDVKDFAESVVKLFTEHDAAFEVASNCNVSLANERTLEINSCAALIKSMPTDQAIQIMKSDITGHPETTVIDGELVVAYVR